MSLNRRHLIMSSLAVLAAGPVFAQNIPELNLSRSGLAIRGVDPVSYFTNGSPIRGNKELAVQHKGGTYWFSSEDNRNLFLENPDAYLPAYGGFCAYGTAVEAKVDGDPYVWHIVDGQLYLNIDKSVDKIWTRNIPRYIRDANKNWTWLQKS